MKALRYLNMRGTPAKLSIEFKDDFIRKTIYNDPIANFEIDPAYLEIPGVLQYLYVNDYSDRTISYNGKRTSTDNVLNELLERDREIDIDTAVENISPKSYL